MFKKITTKIKGIFLKISFKQIWNIGRNAMAILGLFLIFHTFFVPAVQSGCCSAVTITNFPQLVSLQWANLFVQQFQKELEKMKEAGLGKLKSNEVFKYMFSDYYDFYTSIQNSVSRAISQGRKYDWYTLAKQAGTELVPSTIWALEPRNFGKFDAKVSDYAKYIVLRHKYVEDILSDPNYSKLPRYLQDAYLLNIKSQERARSALVNDIVSSTASLKLAQQVKYDLVSKFDLSSIDTSTDKQAIKDLVKLQVMNNQLLAELIKLISEERLYRTSLAIKEIEDKDVEIKRSYYEKASEYSRLK